MPKSRPITMMQEMVLATMAGTKTQTRRLNGLDVINTAPDAWTIQSVAHNLEECDKRGTKVTLTQAVDLPIELFCPYGKPGDLLYVREKWRMVGWDFNSGEIKIEYSDGTQMWCKYPRCDTSDHADWLINYIDNLEKRGVLQKDPNDDERWIFTDKPNPWKPSIHMPREFTRLNLEVVYIGLERLNDISGNDAKQEGMKSCDFGVYLDYTSKLGIFDCWSSIESFTTLWQSIYGLDSWHKNPWVWVVTFKTLGQYGVAVEKESEAANG